MLLIIKLATSYCLYLQRTAQEALKFLNLVVLTIRLNMFAKMRFPVSLANTELDRYLSKGWFRMRQTIFTTSFLHFSSQFYSVLWLRVDLKGYTHGKKQQALFKMNAGFTIKIQALSLREEQETLYQLYRNAISFDISATLNELLIGNESYNRYDTHEVNLYDGDKLIATGFFDLGKTSAAGISCIYHPDYKKHSLGKYLIFLKMDFCRQRNMQYFYPGYLVPGYKAFDYKAGMGKESLEFLQLSSGKWLPYQNFTPDMNPLACMVEKLADLKTRLEKDNVIGHIFYYQFFDGGLDPGFYGESLFDFPVFLYSFSGRDHYNMIAYDVRDSRYHIIQCSAIIHLDTYVYREHIFSEALLKIDKRLLASPLVDEIAEVLPAYI